MNYITYTHEPLEWGTNCLQAPDRGPHECSGICNGQHVCIRCGAFCLCRWCNEGNPRCQSSVTERLVHTDTPVGRVMCCDPPAPVPEAAVDGGEGTFYDVPEPIRYLLLNEDAPDESRPTRGFFNGAVTEAFYRGRQSQLASPYDGLVGEQKCRYCGKPIIALVSYTHDDNDMYCEDEQNIAAPPEPKAAGYEPLHDDASPVGCKAGNAVAPGLVMGKGETNK
jgi:hypothetical protein